MSKSVEKITIGHREYTRFLPYPKAVRDGTVRCFACGQIDEPEFHTLTCEEALIRQGLLQVEQGAT
ncbi:hypothetical protein [Brevundimonas diminuta]|uniref:hypothetical protein n=1 Tax=Brevundimonas diminuta TaxID=293 RepID=UPI0030F70FF2